jgi:hypothetical protein
MRHVLALNENRRAMTPELLEPDLSMESDLLRSFTQAWFLGARGAACKFTVNVSQQSGRKLHVSKITFTRFTTLPYFSYLYVDLYVTAESIKRM